jgi:hypothetical protein
MTSAVAGITNPPIVKTMVTAMTRSTKVAPVSPEARGVRRPRGGRPRPQSRTVLALRRLRGRNHDERLQLQQGLLADALHVHQFLDLILENDRANVYAAEVEVRPPCAPTGRVVSAGFLVSWRSEPIISRSPSPP